MSMESRQIKVLMWNLRATYTAVKIKNDAEFMIPNNLTT